jgi:hypothetical protein
MQRVILVVVCALLLWPVLLQAQKNELAFTFGIALSPDGKGPVTCGEAVPRCPIPPNTIGSIGIGPGFSWQANFARRVVDFKAASLYLELPVSGSIARSTPGLVPLSNQFSSIFFTPSAQVRFLSGARISPFASVGGGLADFRNSTGGSSGATGAVQVGGGLDFKTPLPRISVRAEVRDFITGRPSNNAFSGFTSSHIQTLFAGAGVVFKF